MEIIKALFGGEYSGFWSMMQFIIVMVSIYFIYRQLKAQEQYLKNQLKSQDVTTSNLLWKKWDSHKWYCHAMKYVKIRREWGQADFTMLS